MQKRISFFWKVVPLIRGSEVSHTLVRSRGCRCLRHLLPAQSCTMRLSLHHRGMLRYKINVFYARMTISHGALCFAICTYLSDFMFTLYVLVRFSATVTPTHIKLGQHQLVAYHRNRHPVCLSMHPSVCHTCQWGIVVSYIHNFLVVLCIVPPVYVENS